MPGGNLLKFHRRLSRFPLSTLAQSRWDPVTPADCSQGSATPHGKSTTIKKKGTGRLQACPLNASPRSRLLPDCASYVIDVWQVKSVAFSFLAGLTREDCKMVTALRQFR